MFLLFALKKKIIFQFFLFFVCGSADITLPQNIRQSLRSLPNDSQFPLQPQENQSSMVKEKKKAVKNMFVQNKDVLKVSLVILNHII